MNNEECPICSSTEISLYSKDKIREYLRCHLCELVFVSRRFLLSHEDEKKRYESHKNDENDPEYRNYLFQMIGPVKSRIEKNAIGLDYGCGRTTLLAKLFNQEFLNVDSYDLYFHPNESIYNKKYDFIMMSEVIEHLREPQIDLKKLILLLRPGGKFFIKTKLYPESLDEFNKWFYKRDLTHIQFFSLNTLKFLAKKIRPEGNCLVLEISDFYCLG